MKRYMAIDQYGQAEHGLVYPRRDLMRRCHRSRSQKMYRDKKNGMSVHCGYIVAGRWFDVYEVIPWEKPA